MSVPQGAKGPFRVTQRGVLIAESERPEEAIGIAVERNRAIGVDHIMRIPCLVFSGEGRLICGPANLNPEMI